MRSPDDLHVKETDHHGMRCSRSACDGRQLVVPAPA